MRGGAERSSKGTEWGGESKGQKEAGRRVMASEKEVGANGREKNDALSSPLAHVAIRATMYRRVHPRCDPRYDVPTSTYT
eukprot:6209942-Pleurochrysis_carterae.AAC.1